MESPNPRYFAARARLDTMISLGIRWERIEQTIKNLVELTEEQRAALWLYAFLHSDRFPNRPLEAVRATD